jgi:Ala-tRNA(Pro) deacylase
MPLSERLRSFLESHQAEYTVTTHARAFTAREVAAAEHLRPREIAKTLVIFGDGAYLLVVIPASKLVDLYEVRPVLGLAQARLATEEEMGTLFPDCELGAMPPLGPVYGLTVYMDASLMGQDTIAFNAGTHTELMHMPMSEFHRLVSPRIVSLIREPVAHGW